MHESQPFHAGELAAQRRVLGRDLVKAGQKMIQRQIPAPAAEFLAQQPFVVFGGLDSEERAWATLISGPPGFARAESNQRIRIETLERADDPLLSSLQEGRALGGLAIEPASRRRMRFNGHVQGLPGNAVAIEATEVFSNCPKYIQARNIEFRAPNSGPTRHGQSLTSDQHRWIAAADTLFIASLHPARGADVSHRGGRPGFVRIRDGRLTIPDYSGNNLFQTLGNLSEDPRAGLLFLDFKTKSMLHLSGRASVDWRPEKTLDGAGRLLHFHIDKVWERPGSLGLASGAPESSPYNPGLDIDSGDTTTRSAAGLEQSE